MTTGCKTIKRTKTHNKSTANVVHIASSLYSSLPEFCATI